MKTVSDDSELLEGEVEAVEVDESLFDDVEELELEDEDEWTVEIKLEIFSSS